MHRRIVLAVIAAAVAAVPGTAAAKGTANRVLRVGTYRGIPGQFRSIQAAVDAAKPGDWILIGPGDYKEQSDRAPAGHSDVPAGVLITTSHLYLRGMNRNGVVVDGTKPGSPRCSSKPSDQEFGPAGGKHHRLLGINGLMVWKANDVWIQNLTACNYLHGAGNTGNEIWWNGGENGKIGGRGYLGSYLNATSTFFKNEHTAAQYGIFSSNWDGGTWDQTYASNFSDSGYYIGACQRQCNQVVKHAHAQFSVLGYSGSNSGGTLIVEDSEFDHNQDGFDTNSQNGDNPPPQNGACPGNKISPITHTHSCWVFMHNFVHDNNNPNAPATGAAAHGPVGTGMTVTGGRNDTVMNNRFVNNGAWGVSFAAYPDSGKPCTGGILNSPLLGKGSCLYDEWGDALLNNSFTNDGFFGNPTNGDFDQLNLTAAPTDCFSGNTDTSGSLSPDAARLEQAHPSCDRSTMAANIDLQFENEILCDSQIKLPPLGCQPGDHYPRQQHIVMHPLPKGLKTMPNPCQGVPTNPWCPGRRKR
jgi:hypothetical protein